jgi:hypothetical protein
LNALDGFKDVREVVGQPPVAAHTGTASARTVARSSAHVTPHVDGATPEEFWSQWPAGIC